MRITSGIYKNRKLKMPAGIRPTQEKTRKAIFDIMGDISGLRFLELFAGSGAVGFEALSRQVEEVVLVEDSRACQKVIQEAIRDWKIPNCSLLPLPVPKAIEILVKNNDRFDIIFMDPPYYQDWAKKILQSLSSCDILAPNGFVVAQTHKTENLPDCQGGLILFKRSVYGDTVLWFYKNKLNEVT
ncbi:MAG: 16S rRNA (guanine(966)-N(2))-methyltransferase RsmD [Candidatus Omnitrophica bacterium]|jgi:16S rRNA (guanine(966)-N(2))-methyltransferase RsmD|nr:16S rRNA (guanine(966)-N(2))-methyltransferase RsmD [Candidatus Omnitrophota bacterium]